MVGLVALLEPTQNGNGVFHRGFTHEHLLKTALKCTVLLDELSVLVERGGANEAQFAAREHGLEHVGSRH